ncbi:MAG: SocA family protein [Campylobacterales bacterium]|nr:SocA family protein [Campylobacterales bacterium]
MTLDTKLIKEYYDVVKIAHAIIFFNEQNVQHLGITKLMKLFFFADKLHLEKVGKSIFNHTYTKMPRGPVPMWLYSLIRTSASGIGDYDFNSEVEVFNHLIDTKQIANGEYRFANRVSFDRRFFSKTQLEALHQIADNYRSMTATEISHISHETNAWQHPKMHDIITKASMVEDEEMKRYVAFSERERRNFSENYEIHKIAYR